VTSGLRIGTPALTTRGLGPEEMRQIGAWIVRVLDAPVNEGLLQGVRGEVTELCGTFPLYEELVGA